MLNIHTVHHKNIRQFNITILSWNYFVCIQLQISKLPILCKIGSVCAVHQYTIGILPCLHIVKIFTCDYIATRSICQQHSHWKFYIHLHSLISVVGIKEQRQCYTLAYHHIKWPSTDYSIALGASIYIQGVYCLGRKYSRCSVQYIDIIY